MFVTVATDSGLLQVSPPSVKLVTKPNLCSRGLPNSDVGLFPSWTGVILCEYVVACGPEQLVCDFEPNEALFCLAATHLLTQKCYSAQPRAGFPVVHRQRAANMFSMTKSLARSKQKTSRQRRYQLRHKRAGLCCACSRPAGRGTLFCELHRRTRNLRNRERLRKVFRRKRRYLQAESYKFTGPSLMTVKGGRISRFAI